jgi:hypothetical protein
MANDVEQRRALAHALERTEAAPLMAALATYAGIGLTVLGMMLVIAGTIATGLFLPGVVLLGAGMIAFAVAAVLPLLQRAPRP